MSAVLALRRRQALYGPTGRPPEPPKPAAPDVLHEIVTRLVEAGIVAAAQPVSQVIPLPIAIPYEVETPAEEAAETPEQEACEPAPKCAIKRVWIPRDGLGTPLAINVEHVDGTTRSIAFRRGRDQQVIGFAFDNGLEFAFHRDDLGRILQATAAKQSEV